MALYLETRGTRWANEWIDSPCFVLYELASRAPGKNIDMELGGHVYHVVQNAQSARQVLRDNTDNYPKYFGEYRGFFGESRLTADGEIWRALRDRSQPFITGQTAERVTETARPFFVDAIGNLLAQSANGQAVNVDTEVDFAAARTVCQTVLGYPFEDWGHSVLADMRTVLRFGTVLNFPSSAVSAQAMEAQQATASAALLRLGNRFAEAVAAAPEAGAGLLGMIAQTDNTGVDVFGEMATLLFAGMDTTACAISWALYLLARHPNIQEELRQEIAALPEGASSDAEALSGAVRLQAFLWETLRIFPPIPLISRRALADDTIDGWKITKGNRILVSIIGLQHDSGVFADPSKLRLDRHPLGRPAKEAAGNLLPFGDGRRICPGVRFANTELLIAVALFLERTCIGPGGPANLAFRWDASLRRHGGNFLRVLPRS